jgi:uncharacterized membrane-anchored protein
MNEITSRFLPPEDAQRRELHNEVHARPSARVRLPALIVYVAVLNEGVSREQEWAHLRLLPGHADLSLDRLQGNFLRLRCDHFTVKWERHTEFTRYSIVQSLPAHAVWGAGLPDLAVHVAPGTDWLRGLPGQTMAAIHMGMLQADIEQDNLITTAQAWLGEGAVLASRMGNTTEGQPHSCILTNFRIGADGFERMLVLAPDGTTEARAGRISQRVLEVETYRLMALRGLPVAKNLSAMLSAAESQLADITGLLERKGETDQTLLDLLVALAARIERASTGSGFRPRALTTRWSASVWSSCVSGRSRAPRLWASSCSGVCHPPWPRCKPPKSAWPLWPNGCRAPAPCCARGWTLPPRHKTRCCLKN